MPLIATRGVASVQGFKNLIGMAAPETPPVIGQLYKGGYYFGDINVNGTVYQLIMAPRPEGFTIAQYSTSATLGTADAPTSVVDGWSNTNSNVTAARPANQWVRSLNINGYNDWYIAARDEMELMYRNLKTNSTANSTGNRGYTTQQGDTVFTQGNNQNSVPIGAAYTTGDPAITPIGQFQEGGDQSFVPNATNYNMITSTKYLGAANTMLYQSMLNGLQATTTNVTNSLRVRAIRREVRPVYP